MLRLRAVGFVFYRLTPVKKVTFKIKKPVKVIKKSATTEKKVNTPIKISKNYIPKDTEKYIEILEEQIRLCPEQYYWMHRKYKNLPQSYQNYYDDLKLWE